MNTSPPRPAAFAVALSVATLWLVTASVAGAEMRPTKPQAAAAVTLYKQVLAQCAAQGPACETTAKRQFVEAMNCVVHGRRGINPATVEEDFTGYVDLISTVLDGPEGASGADVGPCFTAVAAAPTSEGPALEALQKFRQQAEELDRPAPPPPPAPEEPSVLEKLKADLEKMKKARATRAVSPGPQLPKPSAPGAATAPAFPQPQTAPSEPIVAPAPAPSVAAPTPLAPSAPGSAPAPATATTPPAASPAPQKCPPGSNFVAGKGCVSKPVTLPPLPASPRPALPQAGSSAAPSGTVPMLPGSPPQLRLAPGTPQKGYYSIPGDLDVPCSIPPAPSYTAAWQSYQKYCPPPKP